MYASVPATLPVCRLYWKTRGLSSYVSWGVGTPNSAEAELEAGHANPMLTVCLIKGSVQPVSFWAQVSFQRTSRGCTISVKELRSCRLLLHQRPEGNLRVLQFAGHLILIRELGPVVTCLPVSHCCR